MNANFGIIEGIDKKIKKKTERYLAIANRALEIVKLQIER